MSTKYIQSIKSLVEKSLNDAYHELLLAVKQMPYSVIRDSIVFSANLHWKADHKIEAINMLQTYIDTMKIDAV